MDIHSIVAADVAVQLPQLGIAACRRPIISIVSNEHAVALHSPTPAPERILPKGLLPPPEHAEPIELGLQLGKAGKDILRAFSMVFLKCAK